MSGDAESVSDGTIRGQAPSYNLLSFIFSGDSRRAAFHVATCIWHLWIFPMNETPVGGREQSFTDDVTFPDYQLYNFDPAIDNVHAAAPQFILTNMRNKMYM